MSGYTKAEIDSRIAASAGSPSFIEITETFAGGANTDDWNPASDADYIRVDRSGGVAGSAIRFTGLLLAIKKRKRIANVRSDGGEVFLDFDGATSAAANRFLSVPWGGGNRAGITAGGVRLRPGDSVDVFYDTASSRWRADRGSLIEAFVDLAGGATHNNVDVADTCGTLVIRQDGGSGDIVVTGILAQPLPFDRAKIVADPSNTDDVVLNHQDGGSSTQFRIPGGADLRLAPGDVVDITFFLDSEWLLG